MDPILKYNLLSKSMDNDGEKKKSDTLQHMSYGSKISTNMYSLCFIFIDMVDSITITRKTTSLMK